MNENEIARIAAAVNALRPDWPLSSLRTLLGQPELAHRPRLDVALALVWVACDADTKTPARVKEAGPWWRAAIGSSDTERAPQPPLASEACKVCGRHGDRCICEEAGPVWRPSNPAPPDAAHQYAEHCRNVIRNAKSNDHQEEA